MSALEMKDFQEGQGLELSDFEEDKTGVRIQPRAASQLATFDALLNEPTEDYYKQSKAQLEDPEQREEYFQRLASNQEGAMQAAQDEAIEMVADEGLSDAVRKHALEGLQSPELLGATQIEQIDLLAEETAVAPSGPNETEESAETRFNMLDSIRSINAEKQELAAAINSLTMSEELGVGETIGDVLELMVPFAEAIHIEHLIRDVKPEDRESNFFLGQRKKELFDVVNNMTAEERGRLTQHIVDQVENNSRIIVGPNDLAAVETLNRMLLNNDYSEVERWFDNATTVLDALFVGGLVRVGKKAFGAAKAGKVSRVKNINPETLMSLEDTTDNLRAARTRATRTEVSPVSPSQIVKDTNPEQAKVIHEVVKADKTDEAAEAFYGASKEEALSNDLLPEAGSGAIRNKVEMDDTILVKYQEPDNIRNKRNQDGGVYLTDTEVLSVRQKLQKDFDTNIKGVELRKSSLQISDDPLGGFRVQARFGPIGSGYKTADRALDIAELALRNYGINRSDLTVYARKGEDWVPTTQEDLKAAQALRQGFSDAKKRIPDELKEIEYEVGLDYRYSFKPEDIDNYELLQTGNVVSKVLDRFGSQWFAQAGQGSVVQNLLDNASVIHPQIANAANMAVDRAFSLRKMYVDEFESFTKQYNKMKPEVRAKMTDYINEANSEGLPLSVTDLYNRGFSSKEVELLKEWRRANDIMWHGVNEDMVQTLRMRGFKQIVHRDSGTELFGRPLSRQGADSNAPVYLVEDDTITGVGPGVLDKLYETGGEIVQLSNPVKIKGEWVDRVMVRNLPGSSFSKTIPDGATVLPYRDGYYPVMYDANWFVEMEVRVGGEVKKKVVGAAQTLDEAKHLVQRMEEVEGPEVKFLAPRLARELEQAGGMFDEGSWNLSQSIGLTAQRVRGERLVDAGADLTHASSGHLKDPLRAVSEQINSLSKRTSMRKVLNSFKKRWLANYAEQLDLPINPKTGQRDFPSSVAAIKANSNIKGEIVADARTSFNYIYSLENGYINAMDEGFKAVLNMAAQFAAEKGMGKLEKALFAGSKVDPVTQAKVTAFRLYISANPLRQAVIQRVSEMTKLGAIAPKYVAGGELAQDLVNLNMVRLGVSKEARYVRLWDEVKESGFLEAVDANTLIRNDMLQLADASKGSKALAILEAPLKFAQRIGFDSAEQDVLLSSWLTHRHLARQAGKNIKSQRVKEEILGQARAYTVAMNRAGEMPYSQNTLGIAAQFFSFQHKALLQPFTNRSLSKMDRAKLMAFSAAIFGIDATVIGLIAQSFMDDTTPSELKDGIEDGLLHVTLNETLSALSGEDQAIDWGDLAPAEAYGVGNVFMGMLSSDLGEVIASSPGGSLLFGQNPRLTQAFKTGLQYFYPPADYNDPELQTTHEDVLRASLSLFSGFSNAFKARYAFEQRKKLSASGNVSDENVTALEAIFTSLGFQTEDEVSYRQYREELFKGREYNAGNDIEQWYRELKSFLARRDMTVREQQVGALILSEAWTVFGQDRPGAIKIISKMLERDAQDGDFKIINGLIRAMNYTTAEDMQKLINKLPAGDVRDKAMQLLETKKELINVD